MWSVVSAKGVDVGEEEGCGKVCEEKVSESGRCK